MHSTKPILRVPERVIPVQDIEIIELSYRPGGELNIALSDGRVEHLSSDTQTNAFLNHLYLRLASATGAEKVDVAVEVEAPREVLVEEIGGLEANP